MYQATRLHSAPMFANETRKLFQTSELGTVGSSRNHKRNAFWPHVFLAMFGAGWAVTFDYGVRIYLAEIISLLGILFLYQSKLLGRYSNLRKIILIYILWIGTITLADLINQSAIFDWARNAGTPLLGGVSLIVCCAALSANPRALLTFLVSTASAKGLLGEPLYSDNFEDIAFSLSSFLENTNIFKVRVEPVLTPFIILIACLNKKKQLKSAVYLFTITGAFYLLADARSSGLVFLFAAALLAKIQLGISLRRRRLIVGLATVLITTVGYTGYVKYTLDYNPTGHNGIQLQQMDNPYNPLGLILQGRSEWSVMPQAISERPIFGWGSWAEDKDLRFSFIRAEKSSGDIYASTDVKDRSYIPTHSLVGGAWVWSGILAFGLMVWLLRIAWNMGLQLHVFSSPLLPAGAVYLMSFFWAFFFSPPMIVRIGFPIALATLIVLATPAQMPLGKRKNKWVKQI